MSAQRAKANPMTRVIPPNLAAASLLDDPKVARILAAFDGAGEEIRSVGGAIRNALLGEPVTEIDFATTAEPDTIIARAAAAKLRSIPTGIEHGTVTIIIEGTPFEITTLREDVETDGRRAKVRFGRSFEHDALRRDFTVNALSLNARGEIFDYTHGIEDLAARRLRFIGDAGQRIREDYLRILRFFRFHAAYGANQPDAAAFHAAIVERDGLNSLSRERIRAELLKLIVARRAPEVIADMCAAGLLAPVLGGIALPARLARIVDIEAAHQTQADPVLRLIGLLVLVHEDAERLHERLRLSNAEARRAATAARALETLHGREAPPAPGDLRAFLFLNGREAATDALRLAHADSRAEPGDPAWIAAARFLADTPEPRLPFSGADLLARGLEPGRGVGETLKRLQALWIRAGFPREPEVLARLLDEAIARVER